MTAHFVNHFPSGCVPNERQAIIPDGYNPMTMRQGTELDDMRGAGRVRTWGLVVHKAKVQKWIQRVMTGVGKTEVQGG